MRYALRRVAHGVGLALAVSLLTFTILELAPGEFFDDLKMDASVTAGTVEALRQEHGLTQSPATRYLRWLGSVMQGDFGVSLAHRTPVAPLLWERARNTLALTVPAMFITWLVALPLGLWAARHRGRLLDRLCDGATSTLLALPDLLIALMLLLLALRTGLFPTGGMFSPGSSDAGLTARLLDFASHACLPLFALIVSTLPAVLRHVRASAIEAADSPTVHAARGHGIGRWRLNLRYILPMAANPLVSLAGLSIAALLSASLLVEVVMSWPGLGPLLVEALLARDVHVVLGASMLATLFLVTGNLLADLTLFAIDPRIRA
ncbi:MAG TPA: ABC transporter permease [Vicinamibacterales bacterium]|nr:ABC transporter permease [Vicinamibacterales bacterium]